MARRKEYSITRGQYNAMLKDGKARACFTCEQVMPRYRGRYPSRCSCGGEIGLPSEVEAATKKIVSGETPNVVVEELIRNSIGD